MSCGDSCSAETHGCSRDPPTSGSVARPPRVKRVRRLPAPSATLPSRSPSRSPPESALSDSAQLLAFPNAAERAQPISCIIALVAGAGLAPFPLLLELTLLLRLLLILLLKLALSLFELIVLSGHSHLAS
jgi:hypothetical protein